MSSSTERGSRLKGIISKRGTNMTSMIEMTNMIEMTSMIEIQIIRANMENSSIESMISMANLTSIMQEKATIATLKHSNRE